MLTTLEGLMVLTMVFSLTLSCVMLWKREALLFGKPSTAIMYFIASAMSIFAYLLYTTLTLPFFIPQDKALCWTALLVTILLPLLTEIFLELRDARRSPH